MAGKMRLADQGFMSIAEVGEFLRLGRTTVFGLMKSGALPYAKLGRPRRVPRRSVVEFGARALTAQSPVDPRRGAI